MSQRGRKVNEKCRRGSMESRRNVTERKNGERNVTEIKKGK